MNAREKEAIDIISDLDEAGFLTIDEIREILILGTKHKKTSERIEDILKRIEKNKRYNQLKEKHRRKLIFERLRR